MPPVVRSAQDDSAEATWYGGHLFTYLLSAAEAGEDGPTVLEITGRPGLEPAEHRHAREDEIAYVLEGRMTVYLDGVPQEAGPGTFVWVPRGVRYTFALHEVTRMLSIVLPGAATEGRFRAFSSPATRRELPPFDHPLADHEAHSAFMAAQDTMITGPPGGD